MFFNMKLKVKAKKNPIAEEPKSTLFVEIRVPSKNLLGLARLIKSVSPFIEFTTAGSLRELRQKSFFQDLRSNDLTAITKEEGII